MTFLKVLEDDFCTMHLQVPTIMASLQIRHSTC